MNNTIEATLSRGPIDKQFIANHIFELLENGKKKQDLSWFYPLIRSAIMEATLIHTHGNQTQAAKVLGVHRFTVHSYYHAYSTWKKGQYE